MDSILPRIISARMSKYRIKKAAVLGAGVMGSQIAAHLANVGVEVLLLDIVPKDAKDEKDRNRFPRMALQRMLKEKKIPPFYAPEFANRITIGNFEDDMPRVAEADWIVEAVVERLDIKKSLFEKVEKYRRPGTIVSTNTSGLSVNAIAEGRSEDFRKHFLGTHFFNPPRFMKLLEIIPARDTAPEVVDFMREFAMRRLGKGVVMAKDTPNFIGNRLAVFHIFHTIHTMMEMDLTVEEVDAITGRAMGRPRSATFRTVDMVGLDVLLHVARNVYENAPNDEMREIFKPPEFLLKMVEKGLLGDKAGAGFYKRINGKKYVIDWKTLEYREATKPKFSSVETALMEEDPGKRIKTLINGRDRAAEFAWRILSAYLIYSANRIPEIADDILNVDNAIKWGFNFRLGPFETYDAIGVRDFVQRIKSEGRDVPGNVQVLLDSGKESFYVQEPTRRLYFDFTKREHVVEDLPRGVIVLKYLKNAGKVVMENNEASLIDLGDGVALLEFHTKANAIGPGIIQMIHQSLEKVRTDFDAMVIGNQGRHFSAGANLALILQTIAEEEWEELDMMVREFQRTSMALKYFEKPIVAAPFGRTLGGGTEFVMHSHRAQAAAETYMGLVEVAVGLLPAGGGTKEMLIRWTRDAMERGEGDPYPYLKEALLTIGMAKVSMSAYEAKKYRYLREGDGVTYNQDLLIHEAKQTALQMARTGFQPPVPKKVKVTGRSGFGYLKMLIYNMLEGRWITEHDAFIAEQVARVLTGGDVPYGMELDEWDILDLEREAFLRLCGTEKTQQRIIHMLNTGKVLRN